MQPNTMLLMLVGNNYKCNNVSYLTKEHVKVKNSNGEQWAVPNVSLLWRFLLFTHLQLVLVVQMLLYMRKRSSTKVLTLRFLRPNVSLSNDRH